MDALDLLVKLHENANRQGPGGDDITRKALEYTHLKNEEHIEVADIGCGSGAQTITLAENINGKIIAIDIFEPFLNKLRENALRKGLSGKIETKRESMESLSLKEDFYDLLWSEGAIYIMGFMNGLNRWKKYLKTNGYIAVTEISWLTGDRPVEIESYWKDEYVEIDTVSNKIRIIEDLGYRFVTGFALPEYCWLDNYYLPMKSRFTTFLHENNCEDAREMVAREEVEMDMYIKYKKYYSYVFYIAQKTD